MKIVTAILAMLLFLNGCSHTKQSTLNPELVIPASSPPQVYKSKAVLYFSQKDMFTDEHVPSRPGEIESLLKQADNLIASAVECLHHDTFSIDFILMIHSDKATSEGYDEESRVSQKMSYDLLRENNYELIGFEGSISDDVTLNSFKEEIIKRNQAYDVPREVVEREWPGFVENYAVLRLLNDLPASSVTGVEVSPWPEVHQLMMRGAFHPDIQKIDTMTDLRSELALARLITMATKKNKHKLSMVIGAGHGACLVELAKAWGCGGRFFRAMSEKGKEEGTHQLDRSKRSLE